MSELIEKMTPLIEETVERLNQKEFRRDPIGGEHFSKIVSVMSSAYKRHGFILKEQFLRGCQRIRISKFGKTEHLL